MTDDALYTPTRRAFLGTVVAAGAAGAGCLGDDDPYGRYEALDTGQANVEAYIRRGGHVKGVDAATGDDADIVRNQYQDEGATVSRSEAEMPGYEHVYTVAADIDTGIDFCTYEHDLETVQAEKAVDLVTANIVDKLVEELWDHRVGARDRDLPKIGKFAVRYDGLDRSEDYWLPGLDRDIDSAFSFGMTIDDLAEYVVKEDGEHHIDREQFRADFEDAQYQADGAEITCTSSVF